MPKNFDYQPGFLYEQRDANGRHIGFISSKFKLNHPNPINVPHVIHRDRIHDTVSF